MFPLPERMQCKRNVTHENHSFRVKLIFWLTKITRYTVCISLSFNLQHTHTHTHRASAYDSREVGHIQRSTQDTTERLNEPSIIIVTSVCMYTVILIDSFSDCS